MTSKKEYYLFGALLLIIPLVIFGVVVWKKSHPTNPEANLKTQTWPAETELTIQKVKQRQDVDETHNATTIDLKTFITARLTESPFNKRGKTGNNLAELPAGTNIYGGVPFDVEGSIQLMGKWLQTYEKQYPLSVNSIPIHRKCAKIHVLHGACFVETKSFGTTVAKLVLHYENGSSKTIDMITGQQVFEWWGATYQTGVPASWWQRAPNTELAWVGTNDWMRINHSLDEVRVCLYRSSFDNPQPDVPISTMDYVSTMTMTCPFMVGLTVE